MSEKDTTLAYYNANAEKFIQRTRVVPFNVIRDEFLQYIPIGGRILDLGAGAGRDSKAFLDAGYQVVAMDGSSELCKETSKYLGQPVICAIFQDYQPEGMFDGIWACASLLHVPSAEMSTIVEKLVQHMNLGGVFYISFKYGEYEGMRNGRFFNDMTEAKLATVLKDVKNLKVEQQKLTQDMRPDRTETWLNVTYRKEVA